MKILSKNSRKFLGAALLGLSLALGQSAQALPEGADVSRGGITIQRPNGTTMQILQDTQKAIVNWDSFSIKSGELVQFIQPDQLSAILNRVTGGDPSEILGALQANGKVFLVNPNGIVFGPESRVDVGSFLATTLNLSDQDFLNGNYELSQDLQKDLAAIVNQGTLKVADGGFLVIAAPMVSNEGLIVANVGQVAIGATTKASVNFDGQGLINFVVPKGLNSQGTVVLNNDSVSSILSEIINNTSILEAQAIRQGDKTHLVGAEGLLLNAGEIQVNGTPGQDAGNIHLDSSAATVLASGSSLEARSSGPASAAGSVIALSEGLSLFAEGASIDISGGVGGTGGFAEVSGDRVRVAGSVDASAPGGTMGLFYVDPVDLTLTEAFLEGLAANFATTVTNDIEIGDAADDVITLQNNVSLTLVSTAGSIFFADTSDMLVASGTGTFDFSAFLDLHLDSQVPDNGIELSTQGQTVRLNSTSGNVYANITGGGLTGSASGYFTVEVLSGGMPITLGEISANQIFLLAPNGSFVDDGNPTTALRGDFASIIANGDIDIQTDLNSLEALATSDLGPGGGSIRISELNDIWVTADATSGSQGNVEINAGGSILLNPYTHLNPFSGTGIPGMAAVEEVRLTAGGGIFGVEEVAIRADSAVLNAGEYVYVYTDVNTLDVSAPYARIFEADGVTVSATLSGEPYSTITSLTGDLTLAAISATGHISLEALLGAILDDGNPTTRAAGETVQLVSNSIGTLAQPIQTTTPNLVVESASYDNPKSAFVEDSGQPEEIGLRIINGDLLDINTLGGARNAVDYSAVSGLSADLGGANTLLEVYGFGEEAIRLGEIDLSGGEFRLLTGPGTNIVDDGDTSTALRARRAELSAGSVVDGTPQDGASIIGVQTDVADLDLFALHSNGVGGDISVTEKDDVALFANAGAAAGKGSINFTAGGDITIGGLLTNVLAGEAINLTSTAGSIVSDGVSVLSAATANLRGETGVGSAANPINTSVGSLNATSNTGGIFVQEADSLNLNASTNSGDIVVTSGGDMTLGLVSTPTRAVLTSTGGSLLDGNLGRVNVVANSAVLSANGSIGAGPSAQSLVSTQGLGQGATNPNLNGFIDTRVQRLDASASNGGVHILQEGDLSVGRVSAGTTAQLVVRGGSMLDGNGDDVNIVANRDSVLVACETIGRRLDPLDVQIAGKLLVGAGGQVDGASVVIDGTVEGGALQEVNLPPGLSCYEGFAPGDVIFNGVGRPVAEEQSPENPLVSQAVQTARAQSNIFLANISSNPFLDNNGSVMGSAFVPVYTLEFAFLVDEDKWLDVLQESIVWEDEADEEE